jgi:UDPglucose 6-dehydrogenase
MARIGVFGAGYVGLVTGACFAELGHSVVVRDVVPRKIDALRRGEVPIHEPGLDELIARNRERLAFTLDVRQAVEGAEFLYVCVDTPPLYSGDADLSRVWTVIDELPRDLDPGAGAAPIVVVKSTVPVGTGETVRAALDGRGLGHVGYVSNPEFTAEGTAVRDFMAPDRIVIGSFDEAEGEAVAALHEGIDAPIVHMDVASAEMVKLASNAFLMTRISFINEIANVCEATGADVVKVAEAVGLDHRLGPHFLRAGIGFGGSCLVGEETVLARRGGHVRLTSLAALFGELASGEEEVVAPTDLEVLAWRPEAERREFLPVAAATRREHDGEILEVRTKMGRRLRCTPDHPFLAASAEGEPVTRRADELTVHDWLPIALGSSDTTAPSLRLDVLAGLGAEELDARDVILRAQPTELTAVGRRAIAAGLESMSHPRGARIRSHDIVRSGALRLDEAYALGLPVAGGMVGTAKNGTYVPTSIEADEAFWRVVGLYIAEGHCGRDGRRRRLQWSFHPRDEEDLVEEVSEFWTGMGVKATRRPLPTTASVSVSSRVLAGWWLGTLGLGANCYDQRLPDLIWEAPEAHKRALLSGLWTGDGSWSYVNRGPSVVLEYGTVSRELADGVLRLLAELGVVARLKIGRTAKSTCDTYWLMVSGGDQVERLLDFVPERQRPPIRAALAQTKRIAPTGYRRRSAHAAWVRVVDVTRERFSGFVYSLEVPGAHTFVTTASIVCHNCFPKDSLALKQLAANSGYHFQLLNAVIEVNELQKRRVIGKLKKHLGDLRGKTIALLGLAFKPDTDDMREAPALVLAGRLLAEGADVRVWDPVADARGLLPQATHCATPLEALSGADGVVVVTEWPELRDLPLDEARRAMRNPLIVDGRNFLDPDAAHSAGFAYEGIGRASSPLATLVETPEPEQAQITS